MQSFPFFETINDSLEFLEGTITCLLNAQDNSLVLYILANALKTDNPYMLSALSIKRLHFCYAG